MARPLVATTERGTKAIAQRLAKIRKEQGITQIEMAKKLKTSQPVYSRYESGGYRIHSELLMTIAKILGVTPNDILGVTKNGNKQVEPLEHSIPRRILRRIKGIEEMTRADQETALMMVETMIKTSRNKRAKKKSATKAK